MNPNKIILIGCVAACVFAGSTATAQMRGGHGGMGMRGGFMPHSMMGRMPMRRGLMMNSPSGFRRFGNRGFNRMDRFGRFNRFNNVILIGDFGFPWWWGWGWSPWWGWR